MERHALFVTKFIFALLFTSTHLIVALQLLRTDEVVAFLLLLPVQILAPLLQSAKFILTSKLFALPLGLLLSEVIVALLLLAFPLSSEPR